MLKYIAIIMTNTDMSLLVLNVDRDDDFGRKAKIKSPIVGLDANMQAAQALAQADPEDSDVNAIFYAIKLYNTLIKQEKDAFIATICGNINIGIKSDEILAHQIDDVLKKTGANEVILITDGAEDEYVLPLVQSRAKITSIQRVSVKQSKELEDTYYRVIKMLDDEKVQKQFLLPVALVLIVWAFFVMLDMTSSGLGAILLTLGLYLLIRVFHWEQNISSLLIELKSGFLTGKLSIYTTIIAAVVLIASLFLAYTNADFVSNVPLVSALSFISNMIWGIVVAGLLVVSGHVVDSYVKEKKALWNYWIYPFSLFAFGFVSSAIFESLHKALLNWPETFYIEPFFTPFFIGNTITGIMITIVGAVTYHYVKDMYQTKENEIELDKQTM